MIFSLIYHWKEQVSSLFCSSIWKIRSYEASSILWHIASTSFLFIKKHKNPELRNRDWFQAIAAKYCPQGRSYLSCKIIHELNFTSSVIFLSPGQYFTTMARKPIFHNTKCSVTARLIFSIICLLPTHLSISFPP